MKTAALPVRANSCHSGNVVIECVSRAGVVKQADTRDLKSRASQEACRFKSGLQHHFPARIGQVSIGRCRSD